MKTQHSLKRGFTLIELMVAMAITTIIVTVLVSITSIAMDTWNRSRSELRASKQAKAAIDIMVGDFEALVTRRGGTNEWLSAITMGTLPGANLQSSNAANLIFLTAAVDRYNGNAGSGASAKPGDISCVGYTLQYQDPISGASGDFKTFTLNRLLLDPDTTYTKMLGKPDLTTEFQPYRSQLESPENFIAENIYQFTITFHVQVLDTTKTPPQLATVPVKMGPTEGGGTTTDFRIQGSGIKTAFAGVTGITPAMLQTGRVTAIEVALTVVSDMAIDQLRNRKVSDKDKGDFLSKNSYQYSKRIEVPSP